MDEVNETKRAKDRSPAFPFIALEQAIERARQFYAEEKRGVAPFPRVAMHWNYSPASSGALQTVAALKSYGLLTEQNSSGKDRLFQLSELALRIILDQREESTDREDYIRQAAQRPAVSQDVYSKWYDGLPSAATLKHYLVLERKFTEVNAVKVSRILKENHDLAMKNASDIEPLDADKMLKEMMDGDPKTSVQAAEVQPAAQAPVTFASAIKGRAPRAHTEQLVSLDGKISVTMHFSDASDAAFYEWIGFYVNARAAALKKAAAEKGPPQEAPPP